MTIKFTKVVYNDIKPLSDINQYGIYKQKNHKSV